MANNVFDVHRHVNLQLKRALTPAFSNFITLSRTKPASLGYFKLFSISYGIYLETVKAKRLYILIHKTSQNNNNNNYNYKFLYSLPVCAKHVGLDKDRSRAVIKITSKEMMGCSKPAKITERSRIISSSEFSKQRYFE